jgi:hypothetical protein
MDHQMRASDADREHAVAMLHEQVGTGRLTLEEFSQRSATAYQSRTVGELDSLVRDLPQPAPASTSTLAAVRPTLLPVLVLLVMAVLLVGAFVALNSMGMLGSMGHMMGG